MMHWLKAKPDTRVRTRAGYTITEVLIVLAVSTAMFVAVVAVFSGRQARVEFTQAVRDFEARLNGIIGDVSNGFYDADFVCTVSGGAPNINLNQIGTTGTNEDCIFLGKTLEPRISEDGGKTSTIHTIVGRRLGDTGADVESYEDAKPAVVENGNIFTHSFQLEVTKIISLHNDMEIAALGFMNPVTGLQGASGGEALVQIRGGSRANIAGLERLNEGALVCLRGQNGQFAEIYVGTGNSQSAIYSVLDTTGEAPCNV